MPIANNFLRSESWHNLDLFAESIPHLLHWDLAYLWILEREARLRPESWSARVKAWRHLLSLFLLGRVETRTQSVEAPLSKATSRTGIREVSVLYYEGKHALGVTSPVVLVRPFPDFGRTEFGHLPIAGWPPVLPNDAALGHFVSLLIATLEVGTEHNPHAITRRLAEILRREFPDAALQVGFQAEALDMDMLDRVSWNGPSESRARAITRRRGDHFRKPVWMPSCASCATRLTVNRDAEAIVAGRDDVVVRCSKGHENSLPLEQLMVWRRSGTDVVVWNDRGRVAAGGGSETEIYPGSVTVHGRTLLFEWDASDFPLSADRFLKVSFDTGKVTEISSLDIMYSKVLVLGDRADTFGGLPVRREWCDAVQEWREPEWIGDEEIRYDLRLRGWPFSFRLVKTKPERRARAGFGIFPRYMGKSWTRYRSFVFGEDANGLAVAPPMSSASSKRQMPWCLELADGWPSYVGVTRADDASVGVSFKTRAPVDYDAADRRFVIAVDFGATSSLVYKQRAGDERAPTVGEDAVSRESIRGMADVVAGSSQARDDAGPRRFLPVPEDHSADPCLVPSAYWSKGEFPIIRWSREAPFTEAVAEHSFKWDSEPRKQASRVSYLKELLFLTLPAVVQTSQGAQLTVAWAYPLSFGDAELVQLTNAWAEVEAYLRDDLGIGDVVQVKLDESRANVLAFGDHDEGKMFLVADLGGSTLDTALFSFKEGRGISYEQIGSLKFAGEVFLAAYLARNRQADYWRCRDTIERGTEDVLVRSESGLLLFSQFAALAYDYLRVMIQSFNVGVNKPVHVILVGNGWRTVAAVSEGTKRVGEKDVTEKFYSFLTQSLGLTNASQYDRTPRDWSAKHLLARGALLFAKTAIAARAAALRLEQPKLPAGMGISFSIAGHEHHKSWHDLVGPDIELLPGIDQTVARDSQIRVLVSEGPTRSETWSRYLASKFDSIEKLSPIAEELTASVRSSLASSPAVLNKGPMQLLLETQWTRILVPQ